MFGKTGDVIREIKKYQSTPLIFIMYLEDSRLYSYSHFQCLGYIEKPFIVEQVRKLIFKASQFLIDDNTERPVVWKKDGITFAKNRRDIIYIENSQRKMAVHYKDDILEIPYKTSEEILKDIDLVQFVRCSRYTMVNRQYIVALNYANRYIKLKHIAEPVGIEIVMKKRFREILEDE